MSPQQIAFMTPVVETDSTQRVWPTYDHDIGLTEAREMIGRWKRANPEKASAGAITRVGLERVLGQEGCVGVRAYYALNAEHSMTLVLVGVDEFGNDMDSGELAERIFSCPPFCPMDSALDS